MNATKILEEMIRKLEKLEPVDGYDSRAEENLDRLLFSTIEACEGPVENSSL